MASCVCCGSPIPNNQGSKTCSMCYGDIDHGKDGYYRAYLEQDTRQEDAEPDQFHGTREQDAPGDLPGDVPE